jgi:hypothetical protein
MTPSSANHTGKDVSRLHLFCCMLFGVSFFISINNTEAQSKTNFVNNVNGLQYGVSGKATIEFAFRHAKPNPNIRLSANAGIASNFSGPWMHPSLNIEFQFYNGGFGSRNDASFFNSRFCLDIITALTATAGINNKYRSAGSAGLQYRNSPLYYFANFVQPALQNPFDYSLSVGTNFIFSSDGKKTSQRIGFFNFHAGKVQLSYYNDGGWPFADIYLGDRRDRYYTGGGTLSYNGRRYTLLETVELGYHKYTGFTKSAFEVSNKMNLAYVNYRKAEQKFYNRSLWILNLANPSNGFGINLRTYNYVDQDIQHKIHWGLSDAYHIVPYKAHWAYNTSYYGAISKTGLR